MKRQYKIILIIVLIILLSIGAYFGIRALLSSTPTDQADEEISTTTDAEDEEISIDTGEETDTPETSTPIDDEVEERVPVAISDQGQNVFDFWINQSDNSINYITIGGAIYRAQEGQEDTEISNQNIQALNFTKQSPSDEYILTAFGDPKNPNWGIFDINDSAWRPLPSVIDEATWSNESDELIAVVENESRRSLEIIPIEDGSIIESDIGTNIIVPQFGIRDIEIEPISGNRIIIAEKPSASFLSRMWEISLDDSSINNLIEGERGLDIKSSEDFIFKYNTPNNFFILDHNLNNVVPVFFTTLPSKCGQEDDLIYCGVPQSDFSENSDSMPDRYLQKEVFTIDDLYQINSEDLNTNRVFESNDGDIDPLDIKNLRVLNGDVYFVNRYNNRLYRVSF